MKKPKPVVCHVQVDRPLHRRIKEMLLVEADRRGVVRVTLAQYIREHLEQAVSPAGGPDHG